MKDLISNFNRQVGFNEEFFQAYKCFWKFCEKKIFTQFGEITGKNSKLINRFNTVLNMNVEFLDLVDLYRFFDVLCLNEIKKELFRYRVSGDISSYENFQSLINKNFGKVMDYSEFKSSYLNLANGIFLIGNFIFVRMVTSAVFEAVVGASSIVALPLAAAFF